MNAELVRAELDALGRQIHVAAETLRILKRKKKLLLSYLDPQRMASRAASVSNAPATTEEAEK